MKIKRSRDIIIFNMITYPSVTLLAIGCLLPFWLIVAAALTDNNAIMINGYKLIPAEFSLMAFRYIFKAPKAILASYVVTIFITVVGTTVGLVMTTMAGYVLNRKDFKYRNVLSFYIYFTMLFSGGMIPAYILIVRVLGLQNNLLAVILPIMLSPFLIFLMRNFMKSIPDEIVESAKIDGAGDFKIFSRIILPLSGAGMATVGLFLAINYWNNWYIPMLYLTRPALYPLQYYLYNILTSQQSAQASGVYIEGMTTFPGESIKMAMTVVATGPILLLYPYIQKYFVKGITIGAVKG